MTNRGSLADRVVLVTGAGKNIGRAIAQRCAAEGAKVAVNDVDAAAAEAVVAELIDAGAEAHAAIGDASDFAEIDRIFAGVEDQLGIVDLLVNNAYIRSGRTTFGSFLQVEPAEWSQFVEANLAMMFGCTQRTARALADAGRSGAVVNISSHGAERAHRNHIPYDSVKGAMDSFTRAVAVDLAPWGIRVNGLRPGTIQVENDPMGWDEESDLRQAQIPLGRPGAPADIAAGVIFLGSNESSYVTGQIFNIDGGLLAQGRPPQTEPVPVGTPASIGQVRSTLLPKP